MGFLDNIVTWFAQKLTLVDVTMWGIQFVSTLQERILLFLVCSVVMAATVILARRVHAPQLRLCVPLIATLVLFRGLYVIFPGKSSGDIVLFLLLAIALIYLPVWLPPRDANSVAPKLGLVRWLLFVALIPAIAVAFVNGWSVYYRLAQRLHRDGAVHRVSTFDLDSLALDPENGTLYASGHGISHLLAYNTLDLTRKPRESPVRSDGAQSFYYNQFNQELYVYNDVDRSLLLLDATTLAIKTSVSNLQMTPGDSRIAYDRQTDSVIVISEGAYWGAPTDPNGDPVAVIDRATAKLIYTMKDCGGDLCIPGLIEIHPRRPLLYLAFPKKVLAYNTVTRQTQGRPFVSSSWVDGMALAPDGNELLVGAPLRSAILRFDATSLEPRGMIDTTFGVRTLAVDSERNLVLAGSLATNVVDVIDLETHKRVAKYYVAPWLRSICLNTRTGKAYISSTEGLFVVDYTSRLPENKRLIREKFTLPTAQARHALRTTR
jgi:DNA-binding beta-propeller fold protein YncE